MIDQLPNVEGLLGLNETGDKVLLTSGRSLHFEGSLFGKYPLEAPQQVQNLSLLSGLHHGLAAVSALENYLQIEATSQGKLVRRLMSQLATLYSHLSHFYLSVLPDYLPPELFAQNPNLSLYFSPSLATGGQESDLDLGQAMGLTQSLGAMSRCLTNLRKAMILLGGRFPVVANLIPGGVSNPPLDEAQILKLIRLLEACKDFVERQWPQDVKSLISQAPDLARIYNFEQGMISFGSLGLDDDTLKGYSAGIYIDGKLEPLNESKVTESLLHTYYLDSRDSRNQILYDLTKSGARTWIKSARYETEPMMTGPLIRMLVTHYGGGNVEISDHTLQLLSELNYDLESCNSGAARLLALPIEGRWSLKNSLQILFSLKPGQALNRAVKFDFSRRGAGLGRVEAPAGSLLHQVFIEKGQIMNYRIVSPQNWNLSTFDEFGKTGVVEQELNFLGAKNLSPLQAARILHSYYAQGLDATQ